MKIQIASDLHLEFFERTQPDFRHIEPVPGADLLVLAGDIHRGTKAFSAFSNWPVPVVYIAGNHEFYFGTFGTVLAELQRLEGDKSAFESLPNRIHFLERGEFVMKHKDGTKDKVRFLGTTMWTDYNLYQNQNKGMKDATLGLNDHRVIRIVGEETFRPEHALEANKGSRAWLAGKLEEPFDGKTVVITHHGPHWNSVAPQFAGSPLNPAFSSDLTDLLGKSVLWIHGHTHASIDYVVRGTRVIANPAGYPVSSGHAFENRNFNPMLIVEI
jgi:predicted phosphodiesterase